MRSGRYVFGLIVFALRNGELAFSGHACAARLEKNRTTMRREAAAAKRDPRPHEKCANLAN